MPIAYDRDDTRRLITVTVTEPRTFEDILAVIDRQLAEDTWDYAMLYDLRYDTRVPTPDELQRLARHVLAVAGSRPRGPVGVAVNSRPERVRTGLTYAQLTSRLVDVEFLLTPRQIDDWLKRNIPLGT